MKKSIPLEQFTLDDLYKGIEQIRYPMSSSDDMAVLRQRPVDKLLYREIFNFTKEELENYQLGSLKTNLFLHLVLTCQNSFLFAGLIKNDAFVDALSPLSNWVVKNTPEAPLELLEAVFHMEQGQGFVHSKKTFKGNVSEDIQTSQIHILVKYLSAMDTPLKFNLAQKFFEQWGEHYVEPLVSEIFYTDKETPFNEFIISQFKMAGINFNKNFPLNSMLPKNNESSFFISSSNLPKLQTLLQYGFVFDEENYRFKGDTLFTALIMEARPDIIKCIMPYLTSACSVKLPRQEQEEIIEKHAAKPYYAELKSFYFKSLFDNLIPLKDKESVSKLKI